jgi:integrase
MQWVKRWGYEMSQHQVEPGVYRLKAGGYYVRGRTKDPRTGQSREVSRAVRHVQTPQEARRWLDGQLSRLAAGGEVEPTRVKFGDYAVSLLERKIVRNEIRSSRTKEQWAQILERHLFPPLGRLCLDEIRFATIERWKDEVAAEIQAGKYSPVSANNWLRILRVILRSAVAEFELSRNPVLGVKDFDTSTHETFTPEEPNSLTPDEVPRFLDKVRELYPQHFAFVAMGFATGLRPSTLRPLRRKTETPDVLWDEGVVLIRRSHTRKQEVMEKPKTGLRQRLTLPEELMDVLEWHVERLPEGLMKESDLLFPSETGEFRSPSCLDKPFDGVVTELKLKKRITPRGMRRTFQDLARAAEVKDVVTRAVSGHATEAMQLHYSTVSPAEMRSSLAKVIDLAGIRQAMAA